MISARIASPSPGGAASLVPPTQMPISSLPQELGQRGDDERAEHRAGQAAHPADDQHRDDQEGEVEVEGLDPHRAEEMREQHAGDAGEEAADDEGDQPMADDVDAGGRAPPPRPRARRASSSAERVS